jgi:hypothetical protein
VVGEFRLGLRGWVGACSFTNSHRCLLR